MMRWACRVDSREDITTRLEPVAPAADEAAAADGETTRKCVMCGVVKDMATFNIVYGQNSGKKWCLYCKQLRMAGYAAGYKLPTMMAAMKRFGPHHMRVDFIDLMREVDWDKEELPPIPLCSTRGPQRDAGGKWVYGEQPVKPTDAQPASAFLALPGLCTKKKIPKAAKRSADDAEASEQAATGGTHTKKQKSAPPALDNTAARFPALAAALAASGDHADAPPRDTSKVTARKPAKQQAPVQRQRKPKSSTQMGDYSKFYPATKDRSERRALAALTVNNTALAAVRKLATTGFEGATKPRQAPTTALAAAATVQPPRVSNEPEPTQQEQGRSGQGGSAGAAAKQPAPVVLQPSPLLQFLRSY